MGQTQPYSIAFTFVKWDDEFGSLPVWAMLNAEHPAGAIPAIADDASVTWAMHKAIGDTIEYTDERGDTFEVMIVGTIANSILQGNLIIAEDRFRTVFPSEEGHRAFLVDAPAEHRDRLRSRTRPARPLGVVDPAPGQARPDQLDCSPPPGRLLRRP